jgi:hypothetical protein
MPLVKMGLGFHVGTSIGGMAAWPHQAGSTSGAIDAAGESTAFIGQIRLATGPGTSITMGATSKILFRTGAVTFANAATNFRIGIQDLAATGLEDGTYDVYRDLTGGGGGLTASAPTVVTLSTSGSKTIAHGDYIAIVFEMTARGGADTVQIAYGSSNLATLPYTTRDTGAGPVRQSTLPQVALIGNNGVTASFDEGCLPSSMTATAFNSGSAPDEYVLGFQLPFGGICDRLVGHLSELDTTETGELLLYHEPFTAGLAVIATGTHDGDKGGSVAGINDGVVFHLGVSPVRLYPGVTYGVAYRPTSAANRTIFRRTISDVAILDCTWLGRSVCGGSRTNQTGAFARETTILPSLGLVLSHLDLPACSPRTRPLRGF